MIVSFSICLLCALQELQNQMEQEAATARAERKKRENAERMCRQASQDKVHVLQPHCLCSCMGLVWSLHSRLLLADFFIPPAVNMI